MSLHRAAAITLLTALPTAALASDWDWSEEFSARHWRPSTIQWAQDISAEPLDADYLVNNFDPPAHEMWCAGDPQTVTQADCNHFDDLLDEWLVDFLQLSGPAQIPQNLEHFPQECASICQTR